jgi:hypothetical protein
MAADGPALLAAAVRAACLAKAPRRTVQAVAAAVASVLARPANLEAAPKMVPAMHAGSLRRPSEDAGGASPEELLAALRAAKSAQRKKKRERRRAAKRAKAAAEAPDKMDLECAPVAVTPPLQQPAAPEFQEVSALNALPRMDRGVLDMLGLEMPSSCDNSSVASDGSAQHKRTVPDGHPDAAPPASRPRLRAADSSNAPPGLPMSGATRQ